MSDKEFGGKFVCVSLKYVYIVTYVLEILSQTF